MKGNPPDFLKELAAKIQGWLTEKEGLSLYEMAKNCCGRGAIVEIGSWKGKSTVWLAAGAKAGQGKKVYAIDPHTGSPESHLWYGKEIWTFDEFQKNIRDAGLAEIVIPIIKTSAEAVKEFNQPVELIFIDGDHHYQSVKQDLELWFPKLIDGGLIVFHDTGDWTLWPGPIRLVKEAIYPSRRFKNIKRVDSMTIAEKTLDNGRKERLKNILCLIPLFFEEFNWRAQAMIKRITHAILEVSSR